MTARNYNLIHQRVLPLALLLIVTLAGCAAREVPEIVDARSATGLRYDLAGEGQRVVLIHGTNLDRRMWQNEAAWMKERAQVLAVDLRGQGQSDFPENPYSNHEDVIDLLRETGSGPAVLIGLSAGVQCALDVALVAPELVSHLVLVSPSMTGYQPEEAPPFLGALMKALRAGEFDAANEVLVAADMMKVPQQSSELVARMIRENGRLWKIPYEKVRTNKPLAITRLAEIDKPSLVLVGDQDMKAVRKQGELLAAKLPRARLEVVPNGNHLLNLTSPRAFRQAVETFLWR